MIIGVGHKARQGKDTVAKFLNRQYGFEIIHFGDALYEECRNCTIYFRGRDKTFFLKSGEEDFFVLRDPSPQAMKWIRRNGVREENLMFKANFAYYGMKKKDGNLLQFWGTEYKRKKIDWNYWVHKVRERVDAEPEKNYAIPDIRFINEAKYIKSKNGEIWKVVRPNFEIIDRNVRHISETELDNWRFDRIFINDGTIEELQEKVDIEYQSFLKKVQSFGR